VTDWATVASFATAAGTLVLAAATFSAVRSGNRSARIAERAFLIDLRPILTSSRLEDPPQRIMYGDRHWVTLKGGRAVVEVIDDIVYLAMQVRNVGNGMAVIEAWNPMPGQAKAQDGWSTTEEFRPQSRALWIAPGDVGFWQGALREPSEALSAQIRRSIAEGVVSVDLLYRDHEGGQRTVSRFSIIKTDVGQEDDLSGWWPSLSNHHALDADERRAGHEGGPPGSAG
jgi:hypothetical protein